MTHGRTGHYHDGSCRRVAVAASAVACLAGAPTRADSLVINGQSHNAVRITGLADGYLVYRTASGKTESARIDTLDLIAVDRGETFADFNQAERFVGSGEPARAVSRYRRMVRLSESFWTDLLDARLCRATDQADQIDRATEYFIRVAQGAFSGPATAAYLMPKSIPNRRDGKVARAISQLSSVSTQLPPGPVRSLLAIYRYELLRRVEDRRASQAAGEVATLTVDDSIGTEQVYGIVQHALRVTLSRNVTPEHLDGLDRAIRYAPEALLPDFLLLKGDVLLAAAQTREALIRASWPYLRVVAHAPDDARSGAALIGAAHALERMESFPQATALLKECLARGDASDDIRHRANEALRRIQGRGKP